MTGRELVYIKQAQESTHLCGDGYFTKKCQEWLERNLQAKKALLTQSCTAALEMAALLIDIQPGDEVIMPSYTFVSTANAFALRGGVPVFVDINPQTLNIDVEQIESAITEKTKAIVPVHYAGVSCDMDAIMSIAQKYRLFVIEDAAQAIMSAYKNKPVGSIGHFVAFSFHETKNIISGEGGALLINDASIIEHAEIIWEKGTNRKQFFRGQVDKYTWVNLGSSFLPSELTAAFLWAQLEEAESITARRVQHWQSYHLLFHKLEMMELLRRPWISSEATHNGHMYYVLLENKDLRAPVLSRLQEDRISANFHYVPLHNSPAGKQCARSHGALQQTVSISERLIRLPFYHELTEAMIEHVVGAFTRHIIDSRKTFASA